MEFERYFGHPGRFSKYIPHCIAEKVRVYSFRVIRRAGIKEGKDIFSNFANTSSSLSDRRR